MDVPRLREEQMKTTVVINKHSATRYFSVVLRWMYCGTCGEEELFAPTPPFKGKYKCLNCHEESDEVN